MPVQIKTLTQSDMELCKKKSVKFLAPEPSAKVVCAETEKSSVSQ